MSEEIKKCPFCGSEAGIRDVYDVIDWTKDCEPVTKLRFVCECKGDECWVSPVTDAFDTEEEAIEAWNRRSEGMTREEARNGLVLWRNRNSDNGYHYKFVEALTIAIKALEQEPCEDCISREKTKQFLYERLDRLNNDELYDIFSRIIDDMYNELPSVTPQPFINKPCVSEGVCREDKIQVLDKIRAEIEQLTITEGGDDYVRKMAELFSLKMKVLHIIDKYKAESEK